MFENVLIINEDEVGNDKPFLWVDLEMSKQMIYFCSLRYADVEP